MGNDLTPSGRGHLRIFRGDRAPEGDPGNAQARGPQEAPKGVCSLADLRQPSKLSTEQIATKFLASIDFAARETRAIAPSGTDIHDVVDALNSRWRALTGRAEIIGRNELRELLQMSPVHLQNATGPNLVFQAAVSIDSTADKTFTKQIPKLKSEGFHVASPAAVAIVLAGLLVKAVEQGKRSFTDHIQTVALRAQALDPMRGHVLPEHHVVVRYDYKRGIMAERHDPKDRSPNVWCAGSSASHDRPVPSPTWWSRLFGS